MIKSILILLIIIMTTEVHSNKISQSAHMFEFDSIDGGTLKLSRYANNVLLIVNTASHCGFTPQYTALQSLWDEYKDKGLIVIGVPSGDFGNQELKTNEKIKNFCESLY